MGRGLQIRAGGDWGRFSSLSEKRSQAAWAVGVSKLKLSALLLFMIA